MRVVYAKRYSVVVLEKNKIKVITCGIQGPGAIPPETYQAHMDDLNNPHEVNLYQLITPLGAAGKWIRFSDDGTHLIPVPAPLTELPPLPQPIDEKVKVDPTDTNTGFLEDKVAGLIYADTTNHVIRLLGYSGVNAPPNYYYGTNDTGQIGFWKIPDSLLPINDFSVEDENEWLNNGSLNFFDWA